jgi:hypothetical protein
MASILYKLRNMSSATAQATIRRGAFFSETNGPAITNKAAAFVVKTKACGWRYPVAVAAAYDLTLGGGAALGYFAGGPA